MDEGNQDHQDVKLKKYNINKCLNFIKETFGNEKPLVKLIKSNSSYYLYDTGTNKILECRREVFDFFHKLLTYPDIKQAINELLTYYKEKEFLKISNEIISAVNKEKILSLKKISQFGLSAHFTNLKELLDTSVQTITLEVTQDCNLQCVYCIYNDHVKDKRKHSQKKMSFDIAKKAIQFLKTHSSANDLVGIGFYGGEPLLRFPFIRKCVEHAKKVFGDREVIFNMTTNATLITPEIATYLLKNGFSIMVSLDGPENVHDMYRIDKTGNGSFQKTIKGLKILSAQYKEIRNGKISINMVYTPPYSSQKLNKIQKFYKSLSIPDLDVVPTYPSQGSIPGNMISRQNLMQDRGLIHWALEKYKKNYQKSVPLVKGSLEQKFAKLMQRPIFKEPLDKCLLNGCCVPGQRKNFISVDGKIHICEKISTFAPDIGDVYKGHDLEKIQQIYIDDYSERSIKDCSRCWALRVCEICYAPVFNEVGELDIEKKRKTCHVMKKTMEQTISYFAALMEENVDKLNYLYQYKLT